MACYTVHINFGSGYVDYTPYLVGQYPLTRTRTLHNDLKPVIGTCKFALNRNCRGLVGQFMTASSDPAVLIFKDSAAFFTGTIRRTVNVSIGQLRIEALECQCVDPLYRLEKKKIITAFTWSDYKVSDPTNKNASILHQLFYLAGFNDAELNFTAIDSVVDRYVVDGSDSAVAIRDLVETILRDTVHTLRPTSSGVVELFDLYPLSYGADIVLATGAGGNIAHGFQIRQDEYKYEAEDVIYWTRELLENKIVFEDTTGATASLPCSIPVTAGHYYPDGADADTPVKCAYALDDYEIVAVDDPVLEWAHTGDVVPQVQTADGLGFKLRFYSATGGVITKLRIRGNATVKLNKCKYSSEIVPNTQEREEIHSELISTQAGAQRIADGRAAWNRNAIYQYTFPEITQEVAPGQIAQFDDALLVQAHQRLRVLSVDDGDNPRTCKAICEAVGDYTPIPVVASPVTVNKPSYPKYPALKELSALTDTADYLGQYGIYQAQRYQCTALPGTWTLVDAGQTAAQVQDSIHTYTPRYLGPHRYPALPGSANISDSYLRYSDIAGDDRRGVFKWDGAAWNRTVDANDLKDAIRDIVDICSINDDSGNNLYGTPEEYGVTSSNVQYIKLALISALKTGDLEVYGTIRAIDGYFKGILDTPPIRTESPQAEAIVCPPGAFCAGSEIVNFIEANFSPSSTSADASGTFDGVSVTKVAHSTSSTDYFAYDGPNHIHTDAIDLNEWVTFDEITNTGILGFIKLKIEIYNHYLFDITSTYYARILVNGIEVASGSQTGVFDSYIVSTAYAFNATGDVITFQIKAPRHSNIAGVRKYGVTSIISHPGIKKSDGSHVFFDADSYYWQNGSITINSNTYSITDNHNYWLGNSLKVVLQDGGTNVWSKIELEPNGWSETYQASITNLFHDYNGSPENAKACQYYMLESSGTRIYNVDGTETFIHDNNFYYYYADNVLYKQSHSPRFYIAGYRHEVSANPKILRIMNQDYDPNNDDNQHYTLESLEAPSINSDEFARFETTRSKSIFFWDGVYHEYITDDSFHNLVEDIDSITIDTVEKSIYKAAGWTKEFIAAGEWLRIFGCDANPDGTGNWQNNGWYEVIKYTPTKLYYGRVIIATPHDMTNIGAGIRYPIRQIYVQFNYSDVERAEDLLPRMQWIWQYGIGARGKFVMQLWPKEGVLEVLNGRKTSGWLFGDETGAQIYAAIANGLLYYEDTLLLHGTISNGSLGIMELTFARRFDDFIRVYGFVTNALGSGNSLAPFYIDITAATTTTYSTVMAW